ncbi:MAG: undecaprenyl/decaprenyl-phosphate alpha-N-acetylglucosaminyl 1-phosphate transferase [Gammaproteobacteria bacterium]|nr:undecaprenyl/decaprenyl-phosphate alpha-N-acetylglucosaminyl 1-phosphate transferase [Gammaproteobacteria bacterium]
MMNTTAIVVAPIATIIFIWLLYPLARMVGLIDKPGGRKDHDGEIPLIGGMAMFLGLCTSLLFIDTLPQNLPIVLMAAGLLLIVGTLDDYLCLSAYSRLLAQVGASLIVILYNEQYLFDVGHLFDGSTIISLGAVAIPFTIFSAVGVTNATNMSDGMDGLAGGLVLVALAAICVATSLSGYTDYTFFLLCFIATILAFLSFNMRAPWRSRASIFMGNGGSMYLGFVLAWLLIQLTQGNFPAIPPVVALWIFALPLLDTVCIMLRRLSKGRSPFAPDREHLHHVLLLAGYTPNQTVWIMLGIAAVLATTGLTAYYNGVPEYLLTYTFVALAGGYLWAMQRAWKVMKLIHRHLVATPQGIGNIAARPVKRSTSK